MTGSPDHVYLAPRMVRREFGEGPVETKNPWMVIHTNDPGWFVTISLTDTTMQDVDFEEIEINRSENDWLHCWIDGGVEERYLEWQGRGGSNNLVEIIGCFVLGLRPKAPHT